MLPLSQQSPNLEYPLGVPLDLLLQGNSESRSLHDDSLPSSILCPAFAGGISLEQP